MGSKEAASGCDLLGDRGAKVTLWWAESELGRKNPTSDPLGFGLPQEFGFDFKQTMLQMPLLLAHFLLIDSWFLSVDKERNSAAPLTNQHPKTVDFYGPDAPSAVVHRKLLMRPPKPRSGPTHPHLHQFCSWGSWPTMLVDIEMCTAEESEHTAHVSTSKWIWTYHVNLPHSNLGHLDCGRPHHHGVVAQSFEKRHVQKHLPNVH